MTANKLLTNRIIVITGATAGIGEACAKLFASHGAKLILTGRRKDRLDALTAVLPKDMVHTCAVDVQHREAMLAALTQLPEAFQAVDTLINNAGLARGLEPLHKQTLNDLEQMVDTNIKGLLYATHALLAGMIERKRGHIVNLGSIAGSYPYPGGNVYGGTKAFSKQFTLNLRADLLGTPVRVTNIEPGMVDTEFSMVRFGGDTQRADSVYANMQPLVADDIADSILWAITRPAHVNINRIEIMPTQQAFSPFAVHRN
jgi:3-hydroxy acid dehydrogenase/malonic semialdehyde reductase